MMVAIRHKVFALSFLPILTQALFGWAIAFVKVAMSCGLLKSCCGIGAVKS
jgi:hypothetical protein